METQTTRDDVVEIKATLRIKKSRIGDLLCSAFEGGSNYWYRIEKKIKPPAKSLKAYAFANGEIFPHIDYPLCEGGGLVVSDFFGAEGDGVRTKTLDMKSLIEGLEVMREKYPSHYANWIDENDDAETGDVFLQCCMFGELVYG